MILELTSAEITVLVYALRDINFVYETEQTKKTRKGILAKIVKLLDTKNEVL